MTTMAATGSKAYEELVQLTREAAVLQSITHLVGWDQETHMPAMGAELRAEQMTLLSGMVHGKTIEPRIGELISACEGDSDVLIDPVAAANIREMRRDYDLATKLPMELVKEIAECASKGMDVWKSAREKNDFKMFLPWLKKTVELNQRKSACLGEGKAADIYDPLLDTFEPGMTAARTEEIFKPLREFTVGLLDRVKGSGKAIDRGPSVMEFPIGAQKSFVQNVTGQIGFDFDAGRFDDTAHPFCQSLNALDVRLTNRYRADGWADAISSGTHEGGHGIYEQGLLDEHFGTPMGVAISLGIHESQSRMYENLVGRSAAFWEWGHKQACAHFGTDFGGAGAKELYESLNIIEPSFIRVEADEVTYNLHIMLRFDMERAMLSGDLACKDLPGEWNKRMKSDFGLDVPEDRVGCLQDVHWSMGAMGYFPTYTFGNLYSAQFWEAMAKDIPERDAQMARGEFGPILKWLREKIHNHGKMWSAEDLCERVTGEPLKSDALMRHLDAKAQAVYGV
jgi:carboxypeptidase Taq